MAKAERVTWVYEPTIARTPNTAHEYLLRWGEDETQHLSSESCDCGYWATLQVDKYGRGEIVNYGAGDFTGTILAGVELREKQPIGKTEFNVEEQV